jgi:hypothetical protein
LGYLRELPFVKAASIRKANFGKSQISELLGIWTQSWISRFPMAHMWKKSPGKKSPGHP